MNSPHRRRIPSNIVPSTNTQRGNRQGRQRQVGNSEIGNNFFSGRRRWQTSGRQLFTKKSRIERKQVRFEESEESKEDLIRQINDEIQNLPIYLDIIDQKNSNLLLKLWNEPIKTTRITANVDTVGSTSNNIINTIPLIGGDDISDIKNSFLAIQYMVDKKLIKSKEQRNNTLKDWLLCRGLHQKNNKKKIHEIDLSERNFQDYTSLKDLTEEWHLNLFCEASETNSERNSNKEILLPMTNLLMEKRELEWFIYKRDLKDVLDNRIISIDAPNNQFEKPSGGLVALPRKARLANRNKMVNNNKKTRKKKKKKSNEEREAEFAKNTEFNKKFTYEEDPVTGEPLYEKARKEQIKENKAFIKKLSLDKISNNVKTYTEDKEKLQEEQSIDQSEEDETVDETIDADTEENKLVKIDKKDEKKILARNNVKIYFKAKPLHKNKNREYGTVKSFEPVYHEFDKMPENTFAYNTFISFFNSKDPFVIIPFFADISDIESIEKLVYYYKSKAKQLQIDILISNSAQEEIDNLYEDVVKNILEKEKDLGKTINDNEAFLCGQVKKGDLNNWESKYKDTMKKILDNGRIDEKMKSILKHFIKQRFTKWFIQYKNKFEVSLTKINLYYE